MPLCHSFKWVHSTLLTPIKYSLHILHYATSTKALSKSSLDLYFLGIIRIEVKLFQIILGANLT
jgi:hypothetical protein